jgi:serine protease DegS
MSSLRPLAYAAGLALAVAAGAWLGSRGAATPAAPPEPRPAAPLSYADPVAQAAPSVINLYIVQRDRGAQAADRSNASAVAVGPQGLLLSSHHAVAGAAAIEATLPDGRTLSARVLGGDPDTDLAVLALAGPPPVPIAVGRASDLRVGDVVLAIGNPYGVGQTVTHGVVSATGRSHLGLTRFENFIQTDAAINPGNSGGALINARGELVGINAAIYSESGGSHGIGFAVPVEIALGVLRQVAAKGRVTRGWLGVAGQDVTPALAAAYGLREPRGVLVSTVTEGSPAQRAGLRPGDVIAAVDGEPAATAFGVLNQVAIREPGAMVRLSGWRGGQRLELQAVVGERPDGLR